MLLGYARVSTAEQHLDGQRSALLAAGCAEIFSDIASGARSRRPGLDALLDRLSPGDVLVVVKLDRLGRSLSHLISLVSSLGDRGIEFRSIGDSIDTSSPGGRLLFHMLGAVAEFERALIVERTKAGLKAAKKRGSLLGRRPALTAERIQVAREMLADDRSVAEVSRIFKVSRTTLWRSVKP